MAVWSLERGLWVAGLLVLAGLAGLVASLKQWHSTGFGHLDYETSLRLVTFSVTALVMSCQVILGTFFLAVLRIPQATQPVPAGGTPAPAVAAQPDPLHNGNAEPALSRDFPSQQDDMGQRVVFPANGHATKWPCD